MLLVGDLLRIRIKRLAPGEQQFATDVVLRELRLEQDRSRLPLFDESATVDGEYLPGATFEERRRHFEERVLPRLDAYPLAFVEASTTNRSADLFAVRVINGPTTKADVRIEFSDRRKIEDEKWWREWYWQGEENDSLVCHALAGGANSVLPSHLFERLLPSLISLSPIGLRTGGPFRGWKQTREGRVQLPSPVQLEELVALLTSGSADITDIIKTEGLLSNFLDASELPLSDLLYEAFELLKQVFRPLLLIRMVRDGSPIGVYILAGNQQFDDPEAEKQRLESMGAQLLRTLQPQDNILSEATRRESLRRLSWFAHQINGPIGRADAALTDVLKCLEINPHLAVQLVPDETTANRMAAMAKQPIEKYQMQTRLEAAARAIRELRGVNYRIRQLRRVQGDVELVPCHLLTIIKREIEYARNSLPTLRVREVDLTDCEIMADERLLAEAIQEIFNNTIREFKARNTDEPTVDVTLSRKRDRVFVTIRDNGLPALMELIQKPFEEDSSTYSQQGKGSGLGLTVVREVIHRHGGSCDLTANHDEDGERVPGVTFSCELPLIRSSLTKPTR
jgi:signal transduction histidine kinase